MNHFFSGNLPIGDEHLNALLFQSSPNADSVFLELFLHSFDAFYDMWFALNANPSDLDRVSIDQLEANSSLIGHLY